MTRRYVVAALLALVAAAVLLAQPPVEDALPCAALAAYAADLEAVAYPSASTRLVRGERSAVKRARREATERLDTCLQRAEAKQ